MTRSAHRAGRASSRAKWTQSIDATGAPDWSTALDALKRSSTSATERRKRSGGTASDSTWASPP
ncbi:MAG: hypothetical protein R3A48_15705 [Polyangiales bacterium]